MIMKPASHKKRNIIIILSIIFALLLAGAGAYFFYFKKTLNATSYEACVAAGNPVMEAFPPQCKTPDGKTFTDTNATTTLEGTAVCLPHKDTDGPQTLECAIGIKTIDGTYYGISGDKERKLSDIAGSDQKIRVTGTVENVNHSIYNITQLISVKSVEEITE
jgi:hypothetical protein